MQGMADLGDHQGSWPTHAVPTPLGMYMGNGDGFGIHELRKSTLSRWRFKHEASDLVAHRQLLGVTRRQRARQLYLYGFSEFRGMLKADH